MKTFTISLIALILSASVYGQKDQYETAMADNLERLAKAENKEDFAIVDCSIGMEATGPHLAPLNDGKTISFKERSNAGQYYLLASNDLVAVDAVASQIVKFDIDEVKQLNIAKSLGLGQTALDKITIQGAALNDLLVPDWEPPVPTGEDFFLQFGNTES